MVVILLCFFIVKLCLANKKKMFKHWQFYSNPGVTFKNSFLRYIFNFIYKMSEILFTLRNAIECTSPCVLCKMMKNRFIYPNINV